MSQILFIAVFAIVNDIWNLYLIPPDLYCSRKEEGHEKVCLTAMSVSSVSIWTELSAHDATHQSVDHRIDSFQNIPFKLIRDRLQDQVDETATNTTFITLKIVCCGVIG